MTPTHPILILPRAYHAHSITHTTSRLINPTSLHATYQYTTNDQAVSHWRPLLRHFASGLTTLEKMVEAKMVECEGFIDATDEVWRDELSEESRRLVSELLDMYETVDKGEMMRIRGLKTVTRWVRGEKEVLVGMLDLVEEVGLKG